MGICRGCFTVQDDHTFCLNGLVEVPVRCAEERSALNMQISLSHFNSEWVVCTTQVDPINMESFQWSPY